MSRGGEITRETERTRAEGRERKDESGRARTEGREREFEEQIIEAVESLTTHPTISAVLAGEDVGERNTCVLSGVLHGD